MPSLPCLTGACKEENFGFRKFVSLYNVDRLKDTTVGSLVDGHSAGDLGLDVLQVDRVEVGLLINFPLGI